MKYFCTQNPESSKKEIFKMVLKQRVQSEPGYSFNVTEQEIDNAVKSMPTFDELCDYIFAWDKKDQNIPDPYRIIEKIDKICTL
jgi:hypothetical protein